MDKTKISESAQRKIKSLKKKLPTDELLKETGRTIGTRLQEVRCSADITNRILTYSDKTGDSLIGKNKDTLSAYEQNALKMSLETLFIFSLLTETSMDEILYSDSEIIEKMSARTGLSVQAINNLKSIQPEDKKLIDDFIHAVANKSIDEKNRLLFDALKTVILLSK